MTSVPQCFCQQTIEELLEEETRVLDGVWNVLLTPSGKIKKMPTSNLQSGDLWHGRASRKRWKVGRCVQQCHIIHTPAGVENGIMWKNLDINVSGSESQYQHLSLTHTHTPLAPGQGTSHDQAETFCPASAFLAGKGPRNPCKTSPRPASALTPTPVLCLGPSQILYSYIWLYANCTNNTQTCSVV